ncbi:hypothetical protein F5Y16DRAFT_393229 [Xylariaceae sp. FL0255]|nr:hypothetical protein F5Y16DRAFT_393229 [Xylariaceae sp. FL0255]
MMRSRHGCLSCRARKIKCDEQKPSCTPCPRGRRECTFSHASLFRNHAAQHRSLKSASLPLLSPEQVRDQQPQGSNDIWVEVPKTLTFSQVHSRGEDTIDPQADTECFPSQKTLSTTHALETNNGASSPLQVPQEPDTYLQSTPFDNKANDRDHSQHTALFAPSVDSSTDHTPWAIEYLPTKKLVSVETCAHFYTPY